jgi:hypothetical protein
VAFEIVTAEDVAAVGRGGELRVKPGTVITDWAREIAHSRDVKIIESDGTARLSIALGCDHGGFPLKEELKRRLQEAYSVRDVGAHMAPTRSTTPTSRPPWVALSPPRNATSGS